MLEKFLKGNSMKIPSWQQWSMTFRSAEKKEKTFGARLEKDIYRAIWRVKGYYQDETAVLWILPEERGDLREKAIRRLRGSL
jgi:hypothetical protein